MRINPNKNMPPLILVYITCKDHKQAQKIAMHLLKKRLIACANMFPIRSMYWWNRKIETGREFVLIGKTKRSLYGKIKKEISATHSYSTPCILKIPVVANNNYSRWILKEIS